MSNSSRKKKEETKRRFEAIKDLMSTFAMSTVAVVAVVTLIPSSPKAEITRSIALSEEVAYTVTITDEENALDLSTLFIVLENQLDYYEYPLELGRNSGYFSGLKTNTSYRLSIYGSKGFGQERLATKMITTKEKVGGTILSVTPEPSEFETSYLVSLSINDPDQTYTSVTLFYGYKDEFEIDTQYTSIPITESNMDIEITNIYSTEGFHIYLEGTTVEGTVLLDELDVFPPFELFASLYKSFIHDDDIGFSVYSDIDVGDISLEMNIYNNNILVRTDQILLDQNNYEHNEFNIENLTPNTSYYFECIATYKNPLTLRQEKAIIYEEEITTLEEYSYTYDLTRFDEYLEIVITLNNPSNYFQTAYYETYDLSEEYDIYLNGETYLLESTGEERFVTLTIYLPTTNAYKILIGLRNQNDYSINQIIDIIIDE